MPNRSNPFKDIEELFDRMGRGLEPSGLAHDVAVDVSETDDDVVVNADLPGYEKSDIDVTVDDNRLTIRAQRDRTTEGTDARYHRRERTHREIRRSLSLPTEIDESASSASYHNGVLTIVLPKRETTEDDGFDIDVQ
ncbi:HSP20 family protein [Halogranum amylolyticum]|uniref:HSP20 family protein n=1 Tax=Halogranum amylolyticum TaxID=660520 RepID=A0A1H8QFN8_9EURY|nr:Hsp20/alpha crystallin family protein [Halogranum amylolyticum]SEO53065.1 HSP20 family protein [Halogranum amylolyticum]